MECARQLLSGERPDAIFVGNDHMAFAVLDVMHGRVPRGIVNRDITNRAGWQQKLAAYGKTFAG